MRIIIFNKRSLHLKHNASKTRSETNLKHRSSCCQPPRADRSKGDLTDSAVEWARPNLIDLSGEVMQG